MHTYAAVIVIPIPAYNYTTDFEIGSHIMGSCPGTAIAAYTSSLVSLPNPFNNG